MKKTILDFEMKLDVPYNHDPNLINRIIPFSKYIDSIYVPCNLKISGSGRFGKRFISVNWSKYDNFTIRTINKLQKHNIDVNMLFNSIVIPHDTFLNFENSKMFNYLKKMHSSGLKHVTVADIRLALLIKKNLPKMKISTSVLAYIDSVPKAMYWKRYIDPEYIGIDLDCVKDLQLIQNIKSSSKSKIRLLVQSGCLPNCPMNPCHYVACAIKERFMFSPNCRKIFAQRPWEMYKGRIIPPYYLFKNYKGIVSQIKILDRTFPSNRIMQNIKFYSLNIESKNFLADISHPVPSEKITRNYLVKPNTYYNCKSAFFKDFPEKLYDIISSCNKNCGECGECKKFWKQSWQVNEDYDKLISIINKHDNKNFHIDRLNTYYPQQHNLTLIRQLKSEIKYFDLKQIVHYLLAINFLEMGDFRNLQKHFSSIQDNALRKHIQSIFLNQKVPLIYFKDREQPDKNSFLYNYRAAKQGDDFVLLKCYLKIKDEKFDSLFETTYHKLSKKQRKELIPDLILNRKFEELKKILDPNASDLQKILAKILSEPTKKDLIKLYKTVENKWIFFIFLLENNIYIKLHPITYFKAALFFTVNFEYDTLINLMQYNLKNDDLGWSLLNHYIKISRSLGLRSLKEKLLKEKIKMQDSKKEFENKTEKSLRYYISIGDFESAIDAALKILNKSEWDNEKIQKILIKLHNIYEV